MIGPTLSRRIGPVIQKDPIYKLGYKGIEKLLVASAKAEEFENLPQKYRDLIIEAERYTQSNSYQHSHDQIDKTLNEFDEQEQGIVATQQASLQNAIQNIEGRIVNSVLDKIFKVTNAFEDESDLISKSDKRDNERELEAVLVAFYVTLMQIYGTSTMASRTKEFGMTGSFKVTAEERKYIRGISKMSSESHVTTVLSDLQKTIQKQHGIEVERRLQPIIDSGRTVTDADLVLARKLAMEGASRVNITNAIKQEYAHNISETRAKAIARTETNRAFTQSQYHADKQFIEQNNLQGRAFKQWTTRSDNPCPICQQLAAQPPIPFLTNFADIGDVLSATYTDGGKTKVLKQPVNFEELSAGNAHVNCSCRYMLVIQ